MSLVPFFLQKTSYNSIALWIPESIGLFNLPITLSSGTGINDFISWDDNPQSTVTIPTINGKILSWSKNTLITGTMTFHPESNALSGIRSIINSQNFSGNTIYGTLSITHVNVQAQYTYRYCSFLTPDPGANIGKFLSDIKIKFSCLKPQVVALGGIVSPIINNILS